MSVWRTMQWAACDLLCGLCTFGHMYRMGLASGLSLGTNCTGFLPVRHSILKAPCSRGPPAPGGNQFLEEAILRHQQQQQDQDGAGAHGGRGGGVSASHASFPSPAPSQAAPSVGVAAISSGAAVGSVLLADSALAHRCARHGMAWLFMSWCCGDCVLRVQGVRTPCLGTSWLYVVSARTWPAHMSRGARPYSCGAPLHKFINVCAGWSCSWPPWRPGCPPWP